MIRDIIDIVLNTFLITGLVMVMMLIIEYINVVSHGKRLQNLQNSRFKQVIFASLMGLFPGCVGGFAVVSLFTHGIVNFGALTAAMIAVLGDESFVMLASIPKTWLILAPIIFMIAVTTGFILNIFVKKTSIKTHNSHLKIHDHDVGNVHGKILENIKHITFQRAMLLVGIGLFVFGILSGLLEHSHEAQDVFNEGECCAYHTNTGLNFWFNERWINIFFAIVSIVTMFIIAKVSNHFIDEHLWEHIIKHHFVKIFLWTFGALLIIHFMLNVVDINNWISSNLISVMFIALLVGLIPQSGPHILFIMLFMNGTIPFSILLVNSIVQDGHSSLPLLAESKRGFVYIKTLKFAIGMIVGLSGYLIGF